MRWARKDTSVLHVFYMYSWYYIAVVLLAVYVFPQRTTDATECRVLRQALLMYQLVVIMVMFGGNSSVFDCVHSPSREIASHQQGNKASLPCCCQQPF